MCIYILHISHHVSLRCTILLNEIGRQLVKAPLAMPGQVPGQGQCVGLSRVQVLL